MLPIVGLIKTSLIDYPHHLASVFFTPGCNFRCSYCHNPQLVNETKNLDLLTADSIWEHLKRRKKMLDGIVITGGEPTLHGDKLVEFILEIKKLGFLIKLDTNGSRPDVLKRLVNDELLDYVAMDIKTSLDKYHSFFTEEVHLSMIRESIEFLKNRDGLSVEFRTTLHPLLHSIEDFQKMVELIAGAPRYVLQTFVNKVTLEPAYADTHPFTKDKMHEMQRLASQYVDHCLLR